MWYQFVKPTCFEYIDFLHHQHILPFKGIVLNILHGKNAKAIIKGEEWLPSQLDILHSNYEYNTVTVWIELQFIEIWSKYIIINGYIWLKCFHGSKIYHRSLFIRNITVRTPRCQFTFNKSSMPPQRERLRSL